MKILLIGSESILILGVEAILEREPEFTLLKTQYKSEGSFPKDLSQAQPELVILEASPNTQLPSLHSTVIKLFPSLPVIIVNNLDNKITLYDHEEIFIEEPAELISVIRNIQARKEENGDKDI